MKRLFFCIAFLLSVISPAAAAFNQALLSAPPNITFSKANPVLPLVTLEMFGCTPNTTSVDNTSCINSALAFLCAPGGGEIFVSNNYFYYNGTVQMLCNNITVMGTGYGSILEAGPSGTFTVGTAVTSSGNKAGIDVLYPKFTNISFTAVTNYSGSIVQLLQGEHIAFDTVNISVPSGNGSTQTNALFTKWVQYTMIHNLHTFVNGYAVYIYLDNAIPENEDHFSIDDSWLYLTGNYLSGTNPASIAIQRVAGRPLDTAMFQFEVKSTHFYQNLTTGFASSNGVLVINEGSGSNSKVLETSAFTSDWFEGLQNGFNTSTMAANDTSMFGTRGCSFLGNAGSAFLGSGVSKTQASAIDDAFAQVGTLENGMKIFFGGNNQVNAVTTLFTDDPAYARYAAKTAGGSLQGVILKSSGVASVSMGATSITIPVAFTGGNAPSIFTVTPEWNSAVFVTDVGSSSFKVQFPSAPANEGFFWSAEVADR